MKDPKSCVIIFFFFFSMLTQVSHAQVTAGSIPPGTSVEYTNITLVDSFTGPPETGLLDLDCDGNDDIAIDLMLGFPSTDMPHRLYLRLLNNTVELWRDSVYHNNMVPFYNYGDTMCNDGYHWRSDSLTLLACGNAFCWPSISVASNVYIAVRHVALQQIGWIKISFDILWSYPVTTSVSEIIRFCTGSGISSFSPEPLFSIFSDPVDNEIIHVFSTTVIAKFELRNVMGQVLNIIQGTKREIRLPETPGVFLITAYDESGNHRTEKVLKK